MGSINFSSVEEAKALIASYTEFAEKQLGEGGEGEDAVIRLTENGDARQVVSAKATGSSDHVYKLFRATDDKTANRRTRDLFEAAIKFLYHNDIPEHVKARMTNFGTGRPLSVRRVTLIARELEVEGRIASGRSLFDSSVRTVEKAISDLIGQCGDTGESQTAYILDKKPQIAVRDGILVAFGQLSEAFKQVQDHAPAAVQQALKILEGLSKECVVNGNAVTCEEFKAELGRINEIILSQIVKLGDSKPIGKDGSTEASVTAGLTAALIDLCSRLHDMRELLRVPQIRAGFAQLKGYPEGFVDKLMARLGPVGRELKSNDCAVGESLLAMFDNRADDFRTRFEGQLKKVFLGFYPESAGLFASVKDELVDTVLLRFADKCAPTGLASEPDELELATVISEVLDSRARLVRHTCGEMDKLIDDKTRARMTELDKKSERIAAEIKELEDKIVGLNGDSEKDDREQVNAKPSVAPHTVNADKPSAEPKKGKFDGIVSFFGALNPFRWLKSKPAQKPSQSSAPANPSVGQQSGAKVSTDHRALRMKNKAHDKKLTEQELKLAEELKSLDERLQTHKRYQAAFNGMLIKLKNECQNIADSAARVSKDWKDSLDTAGLIKVVDQLKERHGGLLIDIETVSDAKPEDDLSKLELNCAKVAPQPEVAPQPQVKLQPQVAPQPPPQPEVQSQTGALPRTDDEDKLIVLANAVTALRPDVDKVIGDCAAAVSVNVKVQKEVLAAKIQAMLGNALARKQLPAMLGRMLEPLRRQPDEQARPAILNTIRDWATKVMKCMSQPAGELTGTRNRKFSREFHPTRQTIDLKGGFLTQGANTCYQVSFINSLLQTPAGQSILKSVLPEKPGYPYVFKNVSDHLMASLNQELVNQRRQFDYFRKRADDLRGKADPASVRDYQFAAASRDEYGRLVEQQKARIADYQRLIADGITVTQEDLKKLPAAFTDLEKAVYLAHLKFGVVTGRYATGANDGNHRPVLGDQSSVEDVGAVFGLKAEAVSVYNLGDLSANQTIEDERLVAWGSVTAAVGSGKQVVIRCGGARSGGHYMSVIGTYGSPLSKDGFGFMVVDSLVGGSVHPLPVPDSTWGDVANLFIFEPPSKSA